MMTGAGTRETVTTAYDLHEVLPSASLYLPVGLGHRGGSELKVGVTVRVSVRAREGDGGANNEQPVLSAPVAARGAAIRRGVFPRSAIPV